MKTSDLSKSLILLVDDLPANLHVLVSALRDDYRIKTATSGEAALKLVALPNKPDLILLDVMMPGMSGIEVMQRLRLSQDTRDIPVIFVSADDSEQTQLAGLALGADDYLIKPVVTSLLQLRVKNLLLRKYAEHQLRLAAHVFDSSGEAIMITDKENCIVEVNPAFTQLTGYTLEEVKGRNPKFLSADPENCELYQSMWQSIRERDFWQGELLDRNKQGHVYPKLLSISVVRNIYNDIDFFIGSFTDISERKAAEKHISELALYDNLTGLCNRFNLQIRLDQALVTAKREQKLVAVLFIDMDRFKTINDTLGHAAGDELLIEVANRLRSNVRDSDIVARWGGDEFVVVLNDVESSAAVARVADKIVKSLGCPYLIKKNRLHSSPSIGIALFPNDGANSEALMKYADMAMYHAKDQGRNNYQFFTSAMNQATVERLQLERDLKTALEEQQFELHYQPQLSAVDCCITGFEALVRWRHPSMGLVPPAKFIRIAEESGLIQPLGEWVLNESCRQLREWRDLGFPVPSMAVNLSAHQLRLTTLLADITRILENHGLKFSDLELEVTESVAMQDPKSCIGQLQALRILGVRLSIDDFGTGYSSLSYLNRLPIHSLKLDRSFVRNTETNQNDVTICAATINLAHNLGLSIVAEGVETSFQRDLLIAHKCDVLQGFLFSPPLPAEQVLAFMQNTTISIQD